MERSPPSDQDSDREMPLNADRENTSLVHAPEDSSPVFAEVEEMALFDYLPPIVPAKSRAEAKQSQDDDVQVVAYEQPPLDFRYLRVADERVEVAAASSLDLPNMAAHWEAIVAGGIYRCSIEVAINPDVPVMPGYLDLLEMSLVGRMPIAEATRGQVHVSFFVDPASKDVERVNAFAAKLGQLLPGTEGLAIEVREVAGAEPTVVSRTEFDWSSI